MSTENTSSEANTGSAPYQPSGETARLAPAAVCQLAARIVQLRRLMPTFPPSVQAQLERLVAPIPFENELLSGRMDDVDRAIREIGQAVAQAETPAVYERPRRKIILPDDDDDLTEPLQIEPNRRIKVPEDEEI